MSDGFVIDTPKGIEFYRLVSMKHQLAIEVKTGLRNSRGSVMSIVNREFGQNFKRKTDALAFMEKKVDDAIIGQNVQAAVEVSLETGQPGICPVGVNNFDESAWVAVDGLGWSSVVAPDDDSAWQLLREHIEAIEPGMTIVEGR